MNESKETYLKTIKLLSEDKQTVRNRDIANELSYSKPSVTNALRKLVAEGYVKIGEKKEILLTRKGTRAANALIEKNRLLTDFFEGLGVSKDGARENACLMEHVLTDEVYEVLKRRKENK